MITRVLAVGLLAGLIAGLCVAVLQTFTTTPLILKAEVFEKADAAKVEGASLWYGPGRGTVASEARVILVHGDAHGATAEGAEEEWEPQDGLERTLYASTATIATAIGFAFLLLAGLLVAGDPIDERRAIGWAAAGFVATGLAPALGLSPEVPGMAAAELAGRQQWWFATAAATAVGLWLILRTDSISLRLLAVVILVAPHVWGAPHLAEAHASSVPAHLAAQFAATSLAVQATLWLLTGFFVGFVWRRLGAGNVSQPA
jgi:cobalt transporter subunit CbtA